MKDEVKDMRLTKTMLTGEASVRVIMTMTMAMTMAITMAISVRRKSDV